MKQFIHIFMILGICSVYAATFVVSVAPSNFGDPGYSPAPTNTGCPGAGSNNTIAPGGAYIGSFAWAIASANCNPGLDSITFSLPANSNILVQNPNWYEFSDPAGAIVDATASAMKAAWIAAGSCKPILVIDGNGNGFNPIVLSSNCTFRGFAIYGFANPLQLNNVSGCKIHGCYFGLNLAGTALNTTGNPQKAIYINGASATNNLVGGTACKDRNVFGLGYATGVEINGGASGNTVRGNYFGTDYTGLALLPNNTGVQGIFVHNSSPSNTIRKNVIAGYTGGSITTGNRFGIQITGSNGTLIDSNYVGLNANGVGTTFGNAYGIETDGSAVRTKIYYNTVSCNGRWGINCNNSGTADSLVLLGNIVGLNATGVYDAANAYSNAISNDFGVAGISIEKFTNVILKNNVISHNGLQTGAPINGFPSEGLGLTVKNCTGVKIQGNKVGVDINGNTRCGNVDNGIMFLSPCSNVLVGGPALTERNIIGSNGRKRGAVWPNIQHGVQTAPGGSFSNFTFENNHIGIGANGTSNVGNYNMGLALWNISNLTVINNFVSRNVFGLFMNAINTGTVYGNTIVYNDDFLANVEGSGICLQNGSTNIQIGSPALGSAGMNYIRNNKNGIWLRKDGTEGAPNQIYIRNNFIENNTGSTGSRVDESSFGPSSNEANGGHGIVISGPSGTVGNNFIGGAGANEANIIDNNRLNGLFIYGVSKNWISQNSFYCNGTGYPIASIWNKGINLELPTANPGNNAYPTPVVYAIGAGSTATTLNGTAPANSLVEIYYTEGCVTCPAPPAGGVSVEGQYYQTTVTTNGAGNWTWSPPGGVNQSYTVTATEPSGTNRNTSEFSTCGYVSEPLPVSLTNFSARLAGEDVFVHWTTSSEKNNAWFIVERSTDGTSFETIGALPGKGNSLTVSQYQLYDTELNDETAKYYYRLKQLDVNGKVTYSNIETVVLSNEEQVDYFPNPTSDYLTVNMKLNSDSPYSIVLENMLGTTLIEMHGEAASGWNEKSIDLSLLPPGTYVLTTTLYNGVSTTKIIKQ